MLNAAITNLEKHVLAAESLSTRGGRRWPLTLRDCFPAPASWRGSASPRADDEFRFGWWADTRARGYFESASAQWPSSQTALRFMQGSAKQLTVPPPQSGAGSRFAAISHVHGEVSQ